MSCHFQVSLEDDQAGKTSRKGFSAFKVRLRKDGEQWQSRPVSVDFQVGEGVPLLVEQKPVEEIHRFPMEGPSGLPNEADLTLLGWCLAHCEPFKQELARAETGDRISVRGKELAVKGKPRELLMQARQAARHLEDGIVLEDCTRPAPPAPRNRL